MKKTKRNQAGFTLIELALIIAVLGILGAVGAVKLIDLTTEAKDAAAKTALANARSGLAIAMAKDTDKDGFVSKAELVATLQEASFNGDDLEIKDGTKVVATLGVEGAAADKITAITGIKP